MKENRIIAAVILAAGFAGIPLLQAAPADNNVRTIRLLQDDDQVSIVSKIYELKHLQQKQQCRAGQLSAGR